jgi:bifunctional enzyme CysN/CysC/sulfate adenylyltransferase subunit 1
MTAESQREKDRNAAETEIESYLHQYQDKELLRFVAVGSVDDGKSTLIGRLLYDTGSVYEDQLAAARKASHMAGTDIDLSLITDGLAAEREQGITIDVAYRYFTTAKRKFIIADTPGHVQYTRNMVTGASTATVAIMLIDARLGVLQQSRRHAYIASLLGIPHLAVCVNKMDLVGFERASFEAVRKEFSGFTKGLDFPSVTFFPISALKGTNCVTRGGDTPWYDGPTVLEFLDAVPARQEREGESFRYPVQYVVRPNLDYRGFAGRIAAGVVKKGDAIMVLPSGKTSRVKAIDVFEGEREQAFVPESVIVRLEDEIDVSRGDMLVHASGPGDVPRVTRTFDAHLVWLHETPLDTGKSYFIKHTTQTSRVSVDRVHSKKDMDTLGDVPATTLRLNEIGRLTLTAHRALFLDAYRTNRDTGSFILVDSISNATVAAGMVIESQGGQNLDAALEDARQGESGGSRSHVSAGERRQRFGVTGAIVLLVTPAVTSAASALSSTVVSSAPLAYAVERALFDRGGSAVLLSSITAEGGIRWLSTARAVADAGLLAVVSIDAAALDEQRARAAADEARLVVVDASGVSVDEGAERVVAALVTRGWLGAS